MKPRAEKTLRCSFCHKSRDAVAKLISSPSDHPRSYICDECVAVCNSVVEADRTMAAPPEDKLNVTISLSRGVLKKARILAARRETSISRLLAREIETLVGTEEAYERAKRESLALLEKGFHLGGMRPAGRDELHDR